MTIFLCTLVVLLLGALAYAGHKIERLQQEAHEKAVATAHTDCIESVKNIVHGAHNAVLLRRLADKWDSVEEKANLARLAAMEYKPGGPSMPTIWLRQQAILFGPGTDDEEER